MKLIKVSAAVTAIVVAMLVGSGCGKDTDNILDQQAAAKKMPPPTAAQLKAGFDQIGANHDKAKQDEIAWAKAHPDLVAKVNADRAATGKPPLGQ